MRIQILPPDLANKIAAGEVVERPASVVKELIENSIDAEATQITVSIRGSGLEGIQVSDNGCGIDQSDLPLALASHATSKIKTIDDLMCIESLGFRGEALASIAAVSHFLLQSCTGENGSGFEINNETNSLEIKPVAHPQGTTVIVNDLFYNVPARRKFLRSAKTEFGHIEEVICRQALSTFSVAFTLLHNKREVLRLPSARNRVEKEKRIATLLGQGFVRNCVYIENARNGLSVCGWAASPEIARNQNDRQYCFLNGRVVRDKLLHHAIRQAYADTLPAGRYPSVVLFLSCDPATVDVNVHPTKHEVRFHDARLVHDFLFRSIKEMFHQEVEHETVNVDNAIIDRYQQDVLVSQHRLKQSLEPKTQSCETTSWKVITSAPSYNLIGVFASRYILKEEENELVLIDAMRVHEEWVKNRLLKEPIRTQPLLVPFRYSINAEVLEKWETYEKWLSKVGIDGSLLGVGSLLIRQIPSLLRGVGLENLLAKCLQVIQQNGEEMIYENLIGIMSEAAAASLCDNRLDSAIAQQILSVYEEMQERGKQYEWRLSNKDILAAFSRKR